jgi:Flp pilus assembly protein TadB
MLIIIVISILLLALDIFLAVLVLNRGKVRDSLNIVLGSLNDQFRDRRAAMLVRNYKRSVSYRMNLFEKIDLFLVDKSNIRMYLPFMNSGLLTAFSAVIFIGIFKPVFGIVGFIPTAAVISLLFSLIPFICLDLMARYNSELVRKRLAEFISILSRWCNVREDLFYAFEKTADSGIGEPLRTFIKDMVIQVDRGIDPAEALDMLRMKVGNPQFTDFIVNVKQNVKHRGKITSLLENLEEQFYRIEEEYNRRRISTYKDRLLIFSVMFVVLFIAWFFIKLNPQVEAFYFATIQGKALLALFSILYLTGFYLSLGIARFRY